MPYADSTLRDRSMVSSAKRRETWSQHAHSCVNSRYHRVGRLYHSSWNSATVQQLTPDHQQCATATLGFSVWMYAVLAPVSIIYKPEHNLQTAAINTLIASAYHLPATACNMFSQKCVLPVPLLLTKEGSKFQHPPLDGSMTIPQIYDWHYAHSPDHPAFVFKDPICGDIKRLTYREIVPAMHMAARSILREIGTYSPHPTSAMYGPIAIVANTGLFAPSVCGSVSAHNCIPQTQSRTSAQLAVC